MPIIVFGVGTNLGNKKSNILKAEKYLKKAFGSHNFLISATSFSSKALVKKNSPKRFASLDYINTAFCFDINLSPYIVLDKIKKIEQRIGRKRSNIIWSPRKIDIDILIYENNQICSEKINIPHKELMNRDFCLIPLIEILEKLQLNTFEYKHSLKKILNNNDI